MSFFVTGSMTTLRSKTDESGKQIISTWQGVAESGNILPILLINIIFFTITAKAVATNADINCNGEGSRVVRDGE